MSNQFIYIQQTDSTNLYIKSINEGGTLPEKSVVYTDFQTAGRGQKGNSWESENGKNLLFSMVLYPEFVAVHEQFILSQITSLALFRILSLYLKNISIKWPNDIYSENKKICGMLIENNIGEAGITQSVLGIGMNVNQEHFAGNAPNPVSMHQITGESYDRLELLNRIVEQISLLYEECKIDKERIIREYKNNLYRKSGFYLYEDCLGNVFKAQIEDIEASGMLVLKTEDGDIRRFAFKEVIFR